MISLDDAISYLANEWCRSGVEKGDTILLHSNIKRTLVKMRKHSIKVMPEHVLESFKVALGTKGTLLLPLFNFNFPDTKYFSINGTPSQMGVLSEIGRLSESSVRTGHPIYSFAVLGHKAELFKNVDNQSGYGSDSPFALLRALNGKIASLDLEDQQSMTFYHHIEEMNQVSYRYFKDFSGTYCDSYGTQSEKTYKLYVRDKEKGVRTHVNPAGELMWDQGLYNGDRPGWSTGLRTISAQDMYTFVTKIIEQGEAEGLLFEFGKSN